MENLQLHIWYIYEYIKTVCHSRCVNITTLARALCTAAAMTSELMAAQLERKYIENYDLLFSMIIYFVVIERVIGSRLECERRTTRRFIPLR